MRWTAGGATEGTECQVRVTFLGERRCTSTQDPRKGKRPWMPMRCWESGRMRRPPRSTLRTVAAHTSSTPTATCVPTGPCRNTRTTPSASSGRRRGSRFGPARAVARPYPTCPVSGCRNTMPRTRRARPPRLRRSCPASAGPRPPRPWRRDDRWTRLPSCRRCRSSVPPPGRPTSSSSGTTTCFPRRVVTSCGHGRRPTPPVRSRVPTPPWRPRTRSCPPR